MASRSYYLKSLSQFLGFIAQDKLGYDAVINSPQLSVALKKQNSIHSSNPLW